MGSCSSTQYVINSAQLTMPTNPSNGKLQETRMCLRKNHSSKNLRVIERKEDPLALDHPKISSLKVLYGKYITSLEICYNLTSETTAKHELMGTGIYREQNKVDFEQDEYIVRLACYYDNVAITSLKILTSNERVLLLGNEKKGQFRREINLIDDNRYVIGFKGLVGEFLSDIWVYSAEFDEELEKSAHSTVIVNFNSEDNSEAEKLWQELVQA